MRILRLHLSNLNSLHGDFTIDFTDRQYEDSGIFLITGPTGAGKSTILDAISLALYGCTPRLSSITASGNEIMSRGAGTCSASVEFEAEGRSYRSTFTHNRARGRASGKLQQPVMELVDVTGNEIIASRISEVKAGIPRVIGMDYGHFTRAVLLAQGEFAKFLRTAPDERGRLLETITGAGIYSDISRAAHETCRTMRGEVQVASAALERRHVLSDDEREARQQQCAALACEREELRRQLSRLDAARTWRSRYDACVRALAELQQRAQALEEERRRFEADEKRLEAAVRATVLRAEAAAYEDADCGLRQDGERLQQAEAERSALRQQLAAAEQDLSGCRMQLRTLEQEELELMTLLGQVRALDVRISTQTTVCTQAHAAYQQCAAGLAQIQSEQSEAQLEADALTGELERVMQDYRQCEDTGRWLSEELAAIRLRFAELGRLERQMQEASASVERVRSEIRTQEQGRRALDDGAREGRQRLQELQQSRLQAQQEREALLEGQSVEYYELAAQNAEQALRLAEVTKQLADRRRELQDGQPCPLCGSVHHPYAQADPPAPDALQQRLVQLRERLRRIGHRGEQILKLEQDVSQAQSALAGTETALAGHEAEAARLHQRREQLDGELARLRRSRDEHAGVLRNDLTAHGLISSDMDLSERLLDDLDAALSRFNALGAARQEHEDRLARLRSDLAVLTSRREACAADAEKKCRSLEEADAALAELRAQRQQLFQDRAADEAEQEMRARVGQARERLAAAEAEGGRLGAAVAAAEAGAAALQRQLQDRQQTRDQAAESLRRALHAQGFADHEAYRAALLPDEEIAGLQDESRRLSTEQERLSGQFDERRREQEQLRSDAPELSDAPGLSDAQALEQACQELTVRQTECDRKWGAVCQELENDDRVRAEIEAERAGIRQRQAALERYARLSELVGAADGKKLRTYVQALTFRRMIDGANTQLRTMTDRYVLLPRQSSPLELDVMDGYEANAVRSADNLSGGESFIVSMALALSLSRMSSGRAQVDTLFLDEGFGALDEVSLGIVLNALNSLQRVNRLIGVISHVSELRESISAQITVKRVRDGRSTLCGPGVTVKSGASRA